MALSLLAACAGDVQSVVAVEQVSDFSQGVALLLDADGLVLELSEPFDRNTLSEGPTALEHPDAASFVLLVWDESDLQATLPCDALLSVTAMRGVAPAELERPLPSEGRLQRLRVPLAGLARSFSGPIENGRTELSEDGMVSSSVNAQVYFQIDVDTEREQGEFDAFSEVVPAQVGDSDQNDVAWLSDIRFVAQSSNGIRLYELGRTEPISNLRFDRIPGELLERFAFTEDPMRPGVVLLSSVGGEVLSGQRATFGSIRHFEIENDSIRLVATATLGQVRPEHLSFEPNSRRFLLGGLPIVRGPAPKVYAGEWPQAELTEVQSLPNAGDNDRLEQILRTGDPRSPFVIPGKGRVYTGSLSALQSVRLEDPQLPEDLRIMDLDFLGTGASDPMWAVGERGMSWRRLSRDTWEPLRDQITLPPRFFPCANPSVDPQKLDYRLEPTSDVELEGDVAYLSYRTCRAIGVVRRDNLCTSLLSFDGEAVLPEPSGVRRMRRGARGLLVALENGEIYFAPRK